MKQYDKKNVGKNLPKKIIPLAVAAAITIQGTGIPVWGGVNNYYRSGSVCGVSKRAVIAQEGSKTITLKKGRTVTLRADKYDLGDGNGGQGYNGINTIVFTTDGNEVEDANIKIEDGTNINVVFQNCRLKTSKGIDIATNPDGIFKFGDNVKLNLKLDGVNSVEFTEADNDNGYYVGNKGTGSGLVLSGNGSLYLKGVNLGADEIEVKGSKIYCDLEIKVKKSIKIKGNGIILASNDLTLDGNGAFELDGDNVLYVKQIADTINSNTQNFKKGIIYKGTEVVINSSDSCTLKGGTGTVYGDPEVPDFKPLAASKLGVNFANLTKNEIEIPTIEYTGEEVTPVTVVNVKKKVISKSLVKNTDYTWEWKAGDDKKSIGKHTIIVKAIDGSGNRGEVEATFDISKPTIKPEDVKVDLSSLTYTGKEQVKEARVEYKNKVLTEGDNNDYKLSGNKGKDVGEYKIQVKGLNNYIGTVEGDAWKWKITEAPLTIKKVEIAKKYYDGDVKANVENIEFEGLQNNEELEEDTDYTVEAKFDTPNVGKRKVTVKVTLKADSNIAKNYKLEKDTFEVEKEIIKSKHPTPVVKGVQSVSKNDGTKFTYTIEPLAGAKYKMDQGEWQDSNVFDGIEPASTHTFSAYIQGDANMEDSEVGTKENVQFNKLANKKPVFDVKVEEEGGKRKLTVVPVNFEAKDGAYSFGDNANYTEELSKGNYVTANTPKVKVYVKLKETAALNESEEVVQEVATDKLTPNLPAPEITNDKYDVDENDPNKFKYTLLVGAQLGIIEGYEYKKDDEDAWKSEANDYVFKGIEPNSTHTFYVRAKADANRNLAAGLTSMKTITFDLLETAEPKLEAEVTGEKGKKTITIKEVEKAQYKFGDDNWGNSNVKNNISDEKMEIGVRILGNATHKASKEVFKTIVVNEKENGGNANNGGSGNNGNAGSGSSSGGSSSGAYVPPVVAPKTEEKKPEAAKDNKKEEPIKENKAPETVPNNNISETPKPVLKVEAEVVSKGKAEANVSFADIENAIEAAKSSEKAIVKLAVETPKGTKATTVKLQEGVLKSVADSVAKALEITANKVKVQFESKALTFLTKKSEGEEVALSIAAVTKLNAKEKKIAGKRPVYDISLKTGDGKITSLGDGKAKISLPYAKKSKEKTSGLYAAYFNKNGKVVKLKVSYSAKTKLITFSTKNLTKYFIGYKASKKNK